MDKRTPTPMLAKAMSNSVTMGAFSTSLRRSSFSLSTASYKRHSGMILMINLGFIKCMCNVEYPTTLPSAAADLLFSWLASMLPSGLVLLF